MRSETLTLNGHPFFVRFWGDPALPPLVLLHGFPEYGGAWDDLAQHLCDHYYCVAPDLRGYGQSWTPSGVSHYATSDLAGDVAALIAHLGRGPVCVLGHDWGASVAYAVALFNPEVVERLIILNGVHPMPFLRAIAAGGAQSAASQYINVLRAPGSEERLARDDFAHLLALFSADMDTAWMTPERLNTYKVEWARPGRLKAMIDWYRASPLKVADPGCPIADIANYPRDMMMVRCPHLLIWGENDTALLPEATVGLEDFAPDLTRAVLPGADHWLHHQKPVEVAQIIRAWIPRLGG
jgi:pimeloyl-ACP methyl ester carboxylesterase